MEFSNQKTSLTGGFGVWGTQCGMRHYFFTAAFLTRAFRWDFLRAAVFFLMTFFVSDSVCDV